MKKLFFISMLLVLAASTSFAQWWTSTQNVTAKVRVLWALTLATGSPNTLNFGTTTKGDSATVDPNSSTAAVPFTADGIQGVSIKVTYSNTNLTGAHGGTPAIPWTPKLVGGQTNSQASAVVVNSGDWVTLSGTFPGLGGKYYFWLGGKLYTDANQAADDYQGSFTLTVSYF
ncbi:MAG: DUF4402 domain-containing protein [Bacteroidota bacterium]